MDPVQGVIEGAILLGVIKIAWDVNKIASSVSSTGGSEPGKGGPTGSLVVKVVPDETEKKDK